MRILKAEKYYEQFIMRSIGTFSIIEKNSNLHHASALRTEFAYLMLTKAHRTTRLEPVGWMISEQVQGGPHGRWVTLSKLLSDFVWLGSPHHHQPPAPCQFCLSGHTSCHVES